MKSKHLKLAMQIDKLQQELEENPESISILNALDILVGELKQVNNNLQVQISYKKRDINTKRVPETKEKNKSVMNEFFEELNERFKPNNQK